MNVTDYRMLESKLIEAEDVFLQQDAIGAKAIEIRTLLRELLAKVVAERIRAEAVENTGHKISR